MSDYQRGEVDQYSDLVPALSELMCCHIQTISHLLPWGLTPHSSLLTPPNISKLVMHHIIILQCTNFDGNIEKDFAEIK